MIDEAQEFSLLEYRNLRGALASSRKASVSLAGDILQKTDPRSLFCGMVSFFLRAWDFELRPKAAAHKLPLSSACHAAQSPGSWPLQIADSGVSKGRTSVKTNGSSQ